MSVFFLVKEKCRNLQLTLKIMYSVLEINLIFIVFKTNNHYIGILSFFQFSLTSSGALSFLVFMTVENLSKKCLNTTPIRSMTKKHCLFLQQIIIPSCSIPSHIFFIF